MKQVDEMLQWYEEQYGKERFREGPSGLYDPVRHIMQTPGKKIRPLLTLMACELFGGKPEIALSPAIALEVFHNFTLVHDDIMDQADLRRGKPTVHKAFGVNAAILAGDLMLTQAYQYLCKVEPTLLPQAMEIFNQTAVEIFEGQQMDMDFEKKAEVTVPEYLQMIAYKTSVLLGAAVQIGALVAGADSKQQQLIYKFGLHLGLAFQIMDDYLDAFGSGDKVGKQIGGDILQNKKTFLWITALQQANEDQKKTLLGLLLEQDPTKKIAGVLELYRALDVVGITLKQIDEWYASAIQALKDIALPEAQKQPLFSLADRIYRRDY